jgi:hypothetical protein
VIEDALNPTIYLEAIKEMTEFKTLSFRSSIDTIILPDALTSKHCLDLKPTQKAELQAIFNLPNLKVKFAKKYCELATEEDADWPDWMSEITDFLMGNPKPVKQSKKEVTLQNA